MILAKKPAFLIVLAVVCMVLAAVAWLLIRANTETTLDFKVVNFVSGGWVWDLTATMQDRVIRGFYQSDSGPVWLRFRHLSPGDATLMLFAPSYEPVNLAVKLDRGENRIEESIAMKGLEITGLDHFLVFEKAAKAVIEAELRPVAADGTAILEHPALALWIGCRIHVEEKNGVPVREENLSGTSRGEELFRGVLSWTWDATPETKFRYRARIPLEKVKADPSPYRVIDYLIVVPDPRVMSRADLDAFMASLWNTRDLGAITALLETEDDRLRWFLDTSWDVKTAQE
ncbi:MAG: hypothetical protein A2177_12470 [Spirochaetes bacterium RBG_13_68_11]|nr:MAG: hypothetical protein A2177_12470 [Spirochaetes bacterium RBG_13_68_11]